MTLTPHEDYEWFNELARRSFGMTQAALLDAKQDSSGRVHIRGPAGDGFALTPDEVTGAHRFNDLQRFLGILFNFETFYHRVAEVAKAQLGQQDPEWQKIRPEKLQMWTAKAGGTPKFVLVMRRLGVDVRAHTVEVLGVSSAAGIARFQEYWRVRNQWVHHSGRRTQRFLQSVPGLDRDRWFDETGPHRCWVLGCHRSRENWQAPAGLWEALPLEQVLGHVNDMVTFIADEAERHYATLVGKMKK